MNAVMLSELFGGTDRYKLLKCFYEQPDRSLGPREAATISSIDPGNASRWLRKWAALGLLVTTQVSGHTKYAAARDPALAPLLQLFQQDKLIFQQLRDVVGELGSKVLAAVVFGSVAAGKDAAQSDVDVILITQLSRLQSQSAFKTLSREIGRSIDVQAFTPKEWENAVRTGDPFAVSVLSEPIVELKGNLYGVEKAG
jgi:predicted nucleotidyltransferase